MGCGSSKEVALAAFTHPQLSVTNRQEKTRDDMIVPQRPLKESPKLTINVFELVKTVGKGSFRHGLRQPHQPLGLHEGKREDVRNEGGKQAARDRGKQTTPPM